MPFFEVRIAGSPPVEYGGPDDHKFYCLEADEVAFIWEANDLIEAMMAIQPRVDSLNEALGERYPDFAVDVENWGFKIVGVCKTELISFDDDWVQNYVGKRVVDNGDEE